MSIEQKRDRSVPHLLRQLLQNIMWDEVGVMRTGAGLARRLAGIAEVSEALMQMGVADDTLAFNLT